MGNIGSYVDITSGRWGHQGRRSVRNVAGSLKKGELKNLHAGLQQDFEIALAPLNQRSDWGSDYPG
jgi:hypothetical protein